jgi:tRNA pseudouridine55 synthase
MFGLLNLDKPAGVTSRDVVNQVQRLVRPVKVGHAGTLDPLATGVLVLGLGPATRLVEYVQRMPKTYLATFEFGKQSDTEDVEGNVVALADPPIPKAADVRMVLPRFLGKILQQPPAYSALKVDGQRAYSLARKGTAVELTPREIEVHALELLEYTYPTLRLRIACGSGTYVRSLGRDLARLLGTEAMLSALRREAIGPFLVGEAIDPTTLSRESIQQGLLSPAIAVASLPQVVISADDSRHFEQGRHVPNRWAIVAEEVAVIDASSKLVAIGSGTADRLQPLKYFGGRVEGQEDQPND